MHLRQNEIIMNVASHPNEGLNILPIDLMTRLNIEQAGRRRSDFYFFFLSLSFFSYRLLDARCEVKVTRETELIFVFIYIFFFPAVRRSAPVHLTLPSWRWLITDGIIKFR